MSEPWDSALDEAVAEWASANRSTMSALSEDYSTGRAASFLGAAEGALLRLLAQHGDRYRSMGADPLPIQNLDGRELIRCRETLARPGKMERKRRRLCRRDGWMCGICFGDFPAHYVPEVDHILPRSLGGGNEWANLRLAHVLCNQTRGNLLDWEPEYPPLVWWNAAAISEFSILGDPTEYRVLGAWVEAWDPPEDSTIAGGSEW